MEQNPQDKKRVMWDLALVEAYLNPDKSTIIKASTPPENKQREIRVFSKIDEKALAEDFWNSLNNDHLTINSSSGYTVYWFLATVRAPLLSNTFVSAVLNGSFPFRNSNL